jgi:hypothetical protein
MTSTGARARAGEAVLPSWLSVVALSAAFAGALAVWDPHVRDLAAQTFRLELFERSGFSLWNSSWFGGHYLPTYSVLFPPLAALLGAQLVGATSVVFSAYLFDRLVCERWGERARPATLWYGVGAVTMLASGRLSFALGVACGLAAVRALQVRKPLLAWVAALACALSNPVAAVFLAGVIGAGAAAAVSGGRLRRLAGLAELAPAAAILALIGALYVAFPGAGREPFVFSAYVAVPLWCLAALYVMHRVQGEQDLRIAVIGYLVATTLLWVVPNAVGGNATRLGALFGGPVLAAVLLSRRPRIPVLALVLVIAGSAYWQVEAAVRDVVQSSGDPATSRSFYLPLTNWLHAHGGTRARLEIPPTFNHWESAYLAPDFQLARGWLRQLDRTRNQIFYEKHLTHDAYRAWLYRNGVRYVALPDSRFDYSGKDEARLIDTDPSYLRLRANLPDWRVYEVRGVPPLVAARDDAKAHLVALDPQSFTLRTSGAGRFVVRVRWTPYWKLSAGSGCIGRDGDWTLVRADAPGRVRATIAFSPGRAGRAAAGSRKVC